MIRIINLLRMHAFMEGFNHAKQRDAAILEGAGALIEKMGTELQKAHIELAASTVLLEQQEPDPGAEGSGRRLAGICRDDVHAARWGLL